MLEKLELILGGSFEDPEEGLFYLDEASQVILRYTNLNRLDASFETPIVLLAAHFYKNSSIVKSKTEGQKSVTFANISIPSEIKELLPRPRIGVI